MNASQVVSFLVVIASVAFVKCAPVEEPSAPVNDDVNNQRKLFELLYPDASKKAAGNGQQQGDLFREERRFEPVAGSWERFYNPRKRAPCLLNAGLSHGCDVMDFLAAKHQQSKFADFAGPGKKRR